MKILISYKKELVFVLLILCISIKSNAQEDAINIGSLYISPGTIISTLGDFKNTGTTTVGDTGNFYVKGNWNNTGTFNSNLSTIIFNGTGAQTISGNAVFKNFTINNSKPANALILNNPVTINGVFSLTNGHIITTASNILTLGSAATVVLNAINQDSSFVKGPMIQTVDSITSILKVFPVGKNNQMHRADLTVIQSSIAATTYMMEYIDSSARDLTYALPPTLQRVSNIGYWRSSKGAGAAVSNGIIKLYYYASDDVNSPTCLRIAQDNGLNTWTDIAGTGTTAPTGTITSVNNFTTLSSFTLANGMCAGNPLPVELIKFTAQANENNVDIAWSTATEKNCDYFEIERSANEVDFESIGKVKGSGNSNAVIDYKWIDTKPLQSISYYRIKQVDFNGEFQYSDERVIDITTKKHEEDIIVYPNPSNGKLFHIAFAHQILTVVHESKINVQLFDESGKLVFGASEGLNGNYEKDMELDFNQKLESGIYLLKLKSDNLSINKLVVIN